MTTNEDATGGITRRDILKGVATIAAAETIDLVIGTDEAFARDATPEQKRDGLAFKHRSAGALRAWRDNLRTLSPAVKRDYQAQLSRATFQNPTQFGPTWNRNRDMWAGLPCLEPVERVEVRFFKLPNDTRNWAKYSFIDRNGRLCFFGAFHEIEQRQPVIEDNDLK